MYEVKKNYTGYKEMNLLTRKLISALSDSFDLYGNYFTYYDKFNNEKVIVAVDNFIFKYDKRFFSGSELYELIFKDIITGYKNWSYYIINRKKNGYISDLPISKDSISKMTQLLFLFCQIDEIIDDFPLIDEKYLATEIDNKIKKNQIINSSTFEYYLNYLYENGKLKGKTIDFLYDKLINNILTQNTTFSFFNTISDEILEIFKNHKYNSIDKNRLFNFCSDMFKGSIFSPYSDSFDKEYYNNVCSKLNDMFFINLDEEEALKVVIEEINYFNIWEINYLINYFKKNLGDFETIRSKLKGINGVNSVFENISLLLLDETDVSINNKIDILKELCTNVIYAKKLFECNYVNPSDFIDVIPKNNGNYLKEFILFYKDKLSKDELIRLGKYVVESDDYRLIFGLCDELNEISINDFANDILKRNENNVDTLLINWMIDNGNIKFLVNIFGSYEKLYTEICHRLVNDEPVDYSILKKIEDKCNPLFVMQMQFLTSEIREFKETFNKTLNSIQSTRSSKINFYTSVRNELIKIKRKRNRP